MLIHKKRGLQSPVREVSLRAADESVSSLENSPNDISPQNSEQERVTENKAPDYSERNKTGLPLAEEIIAAEPRPGSNQGKVSKSVGAAGAFPRKFESYELVWEVCRDALSVTYAAQREGMEGLLSVRIFDARTTSATQLKTIQQAAKKASELTHPNHITVYDNAVSAGGEPYVVTDYAEAESLAQLFPVVKRLNIARFLSIFNQVCEVLREAHSRQLIHANLAPNKILLAADHEIDIDSVKVIDFGMPPDPVQNAFYLSPEQNLDRNKIDARTDIYSLGCIMYEALCGSPPFVGHSKSQAAINYLHELANQYSPDAPEHNALKLLDCIIVKCLQKKPGKRFRNVNELMDALKLVNDCICNGSGKKLPPKAEKLLLFRFLDFFDKKIVACMFSYLLLGGIAVKYIGELQLQKDIDAAELAALEHDLPLAQSSWKAAITQANRLNKPESLKAELHWELGNVLAEQASEANMRIKPKYSRLENAIDVSKDAIAEFEQALPYYEKGTHFRSRSIMLLTQIGELWDSISFNQSEKTAAEMRDEDAKALKDVRSLYKAKDYRKCADYVKSYLTKNRTTESGNFVAGIKAKSTSELKEMCKLAAYSCSKLASTMPALAGVRYFERTLFFFDIAEMNSSSAILNLQTCWKNAGGYSNPEADAWDAAVAGDEIATLGEFSYTPVRHAWQVREACDDYLTRQNEAERILAGRSLESIAPLEKVLKLEETSFGEHSPILTDALSQLARSYARKDDSQKACALYKRLFSLVDSSHYLPLTGYVGSRLCRAYDEDLVIYCNLLKAKGKNKDALALLEKYLLDNDPQVDYKYGLKYMLVKAYLENGLTDKAKEYFSKHIQEDSFAENEEEKADAFSTGN